MDNSNTERDQVEKRIAIQVNNRQFRDVIADAWKAIHEVNKLKRQIFRRENTLVQLVREKGKQVIRALKLEEAFGILIRNADWFRVGANDSLIPTKPSKDCARDILVYPDPALPALDAVITTPVFNENGHLVSEPGYHENLGIYLDSHDALAFPSLPDRISETDIICAKSLLLNNLLGDFPFVSASDRTHVIAALMQPFIRAYFGGCSPMYLIEASCPGTGKGLLTNVISIIVTGQHAESRTLPGTDDEVRKMLTSELSRGRQIIVLDNADTNEKASKIHSSALASVLTAKVWTDRFLGESRMISMPNKALWIMTGNNPQLTSELARRSVRIRIDAKTKSPWLRDGFKHSDLEKWAQDNRSQLVHALLILIQNWLNLGASKSSQKSLGSFEDWSSVIGGILASNGFDGFLENLGDLYKESDSESKEWDLLIELWLERHSGSPLRIQRLNALCEEADLLEDMRGTGSPKSQQTKLGVALRKIRGRVFAGYQIELAEDRKKHGKYYCLKKIYSEDPGQLKMVDVLNGSQGYHIQTELKN